MRTADDDALLCRLGERVRAEREQRSLSLRALSEQAGVSTRFLSEVESGKANPSVLTLEALGRALGRSAAELLGALTAAAPQPKREGPLLTLLGLRGAGKSTVGRLAADRLGVPFIELDEEIAREAGMPAGMVIELYGAMALRERERKALDSLIERGEAAIVATAGGIVTHHPTFERLSRATTTVWLKARAEHHMERVVAQGDLRPMRERPDAMRELAALLAARRPLYERAAHVVDTSALGLTKSVGRLVRIAEGAFRAKPFPRSESARNAPGAPAVR